MLVLLLAAVGCRTVTDESKGDETQSAGPAVDSISTNRMSIRYARNFSVSYHDAYKIIRLASNDEEHNQLKPRYVVLVQRGRPKPQLPDSLADALVMEVPVRSAAVNEDGDASRITALGEIDKLIGLGGGEIYDPELRKRWEQKRIASLGYSFHSLPETEVLLSLRPDVLFLFTHDPEQMKGLDQFRQLGIRAVPVLAWDEPSFLGKAEWIKFTALFFNAEAKADSLFTRIETRCLKLMQLAHQQRPPVKVLSFHPSNGLGFAHRNDFFASYLTAAGGVNVLADQGPNRVARMTNEEVYALARNADVWIVADTSDTSSEWPPASYLNGFKAYRNGQLYHYHRRVHYAHNAYDWYETAEVRPDLVLADLVSIFYPNVLPDHSLFFFKKVHLTKQN